MPSFKELKPDVPQKDFRDDLNQNFKSAATYPVDKNEGVVEPLILTGVKEKSSQELLHAVDGVDYLSPSTGIMKSESGEQVIQGKLTANGLEIPKGGASITGDLKVSNDNGVVIFSANNSEVKSSVSLITSGEIRTGTGANLANGKMVVNSTEVRAPKLDASFRNVRVSDKVTSENGSISNLTVSKDLYTNKLKVSNIMTVTPGVGSVLDGSTEVKGPAVFRQNVQLSAPGSIDGTYVRPMKISNSAPSNIRSIPVGALWAQI